MTGEATRTARSATASDEPFLRALYAATRHAELAMTPWSEEQRAQFVALQFEAQRRHYAERFPHAEHLVLLADGAPAGRLWVDKGPEAFRVLDLSVHPDHAGSGVGADALRELAAEADALARPIRAYLDPTDPLLPGYLVLGYREASSTGTTTLYERPPPPSNP